MAGDLDTLKLWELQLAADASYGLLKKENRPLGSEPVWRIDLVGRIRPERIPPPSRS